MLRILYRWDHRKTSEPLPRISNDKIQNSKVRLSPPYKTALRAPDSLLPHCVLREEATRRHLSLHSQPTVLFFFFDVQRKRSKKKGQPSEALPRISNRKIQNSKVKPTFPGKTAAPCVRWSERLRLEGMYDPKRPHTTLSHCE